MRSRTTLITLGVVAVVAIAATAWVMKSHSDAPHLGVALVDSMHSRQPEMTPESVPHVDMPVPEPRSVPTKLAEPARDAAPAPRQKPPAPRLADSPEPVVPEDVAREALSYVGADPAAEEVWYAAINDPQMPAKTRQNLIEDLNEDGFPDPKNLTADDLPLIVSRLQLIEAVAPDAPDEVNAAAFAEAYKDLVNMFIRVTGS
jgi:hypothetical protein